MYKKGVVIEIQFPPERLNDAAGDPYWIDLTLDEAKRLHAQLSRRFEGDARANQPLDTFTIEERKPTSECTVKQDEHATSGGYCRISFRRMPHMVSIFAAPVFVFLWSTGFIVARAITPYVDPNLYLLARFAGTTLLFVAIAAIARAPWPKCRDIGRHLFAGALLQGVYLGAGYCAVAQGLGAGIMALLGALQPLLTAAVAARLFGERLSPRAWSGLGLGLAGVALVLAPKIAASGAHVEQASGGHAPQWIVVTIAVLAVAAITAGTLYQKTSLAHADIRSASALQNAGATIVALVLVLALGEHRFIASATTWLALAWGIVMLSGVATTLLVWMVRRGDASRATALLFLAPPLAALESYLAFGETLNAVQLAGFGAALAGVLLARAK